MEAKGKKGKKKKRRRRRKKRSGRDALEIVWDDGPNAKYDSFCLSDRRETARKGKGEEKGGETAVRGE